MSKARILARDTVTALQQRQIDIASSLIVLGCGAALILAGQPLPV